MSTPHAFVAWFTAPKKLDQAVQLRSRLKRLEWALEEDPELYSPEARTLMTEEAARIRAALAAPPAN